VKFTLRPYGGGETALAQTVITGDANEDPLPAMPAAVMAGTLFTFGGVLDVVVDVVVEVGAVDVVVVLVAVGAVDVVVVLVAVVDVDLDVDVDVPAVSAPAAVAVRTSTRSEVRPTSTVEPFRTRCRGRLRWCAGRRVFIGVDSLGFCRNGRNGRLRWLWRGITAACGLLPV
jgi:hypothetical protein